MNLKTNKIFIKHGIPEAKYLLIRFQGVSLRTYNANSRSQHIAYPCPDPNSPCSPTAYDDKPDAGCVQLPICITLAIWMNDLLTCSLHAKRWRGKPTEARTKTNISMIETHLKETHLHVLRVGWEGKKHKTQNKFSYFSKQGIFKLRALIQETELLYHDQFDCLDPTKIFCRAKRPNT